MPDMPDTSITPYVGVTQITGERYGYKFSCLLIDTRNRRVHIPNTQGTLIRPSDFAMQTGAIIAVNASPWTKTQPYTPLGLAVSDGVIYQPNTRQPYLNVTREGVVKIGTRESDDWYNAFAGFRYLIQNGIIPDYLKGSDVQYTERHPRSLWGLHQDGRLISVAVEGRTESGDGITLYEGALILKSFGAVQGFDGDSGGSTIQVVGGELAITPSDPVGERPVINPFLIFDVEGGNMATYEVTTQRSNMSLRNDHNTGADRIGSIPNAQTVLPADEIWTAPSDLFNNSGVQINRAGDQWARLVNENAWIAVTHLGVVYSTYKVLTPPNPPPTGRTATVMIKVDGYKAQTINITLDPE
jgi:exopolysaccharide biosynthesis protein